MPYAIDFSEDAANHVSELTPREQRIVLDAIATHLTNTPLQPTRNRKPMRPNSLAPWELRIGNFRAYYEVDENSRTVIVHAIGIKRHNCVFVGGKEIQL